RDARRAQDPVARVSLSLDRRAARRVRGSRRLDAHGLRRHPPAARRARAHARAGDRRVAPHRAQARARRLRRARAAMTPLDWIARWQEPPWSDVQAALREGRPTGERDLRGVDLRGVSLGAIDLSGTALAFARLDGAVLDGARLTGVYAPYVCAV